MTRPFNPAVLRYRVSVFIDLYRKSAESAEIALRCAARPRTGPRWKHAGGRPT